MAKTPATWPSAVLYEELNPKRDMVVDRACDRIFRAHLNLGAWGRSMHAACVLSSSCMDSR